jgi:hypothetical protein
LLPEFLIGTGVFVSHEITTDLIVYLINGIIFGFILIIVFISLTFSVLIIKNAMEESEKIDDIESISDT